MFPYWHVKVCSGVALAVVIVSAHLQRGGEMFHFLCNRISITLSQRVRGHPVDQVGWVIAVTLPSTTAGRWCNWWTAAAQCCSYLADWLMAYFFHKDAHKTDLFFEIATMGNMSCVKWRICFFNWITFCSRVLWPIKSILPDVLLAALRYKRSVMKFASAVDQLSPQYNNHNWSNGLCKPSIHILTTQTRSLGYCSAREETSHRAVQLDSTTES